MPSKLAKNAAQIEHEVRELRRAELKALMTIDQVPAWQVQDVQREQHRRRAKWEALEWVLGYSVGLL